MSYDRYLQTGPYNFLPGQPDKVEHFPYQNGLLVSYWDTSFTDNNESQHPGQGEMLPIDANPRPIYDLDGTLWRGRIQTYDAPFGSRSRTRSRSPRRRGGRATSAARPRSRCSTTDASSGTRRCRTSA